MRVDQFVPIKKVGTALTTKVSGDSLGLNTSTPSGQFHTVLSAGKPALFGGDTLATVTGVSGTDADPTVLTVATTNGIAIGDAVIINSGTNATVGTYICTAVVVDTSVTLDRNASSGGAIAAASVTYVNDALVIENGTNGEPRIILPLKNDAATPTLAFGDGDSGFYESVDGVLNVAIGGSMVYYFHDTKIGTNNTNGPAMLNETPSSINPTFTPNRSDLDTGLGHAAADALSLIAGGVEAQRLTEFGSKPYSTIGGTGIANLTACTFPTATKTQISKTGVGTGMAVGDLVYVTGGTNATVGAYRATTIDSADLITVDRDIHAEGTNITDGTVSTIKDAILLSPTDGTNGQRIMGYSHQNKPLQIGGDTLAATGHSLGSKDVLIGNLLEVNGAAYFDDTIEMGGGQIVHKTDMGANPYNPTALTSDYIITVDTTAAARAVTISTEDRDTGSANNPRIFIIKDIAGNAGANNITVSLETAGNIDGAGTAVINGNYNSITLAIEK